MFTYHYENKAAINAAIEVVFAFIDDHSNFSSHMNKSSWMMGGGKMTTTVDAGKGQKVGSHIIMNGAAFGIKLFLDEVITQHNPPLTKTWKTVGNPRLVVIGHYQMGIEITPQEKSSLLRVFIDYDLPSKHQWLGSLFGSLYAKWCVHQMLQSASNSNH